MSREDSAVEALFKFILAMLGAAVVLNIIDQATKEKKYVCPSCGTALRRGLIRCPNCGTRLRWA